MKQTMCPNLAVCPSIPDFTLYMAEQRGSKGWHFLHLVCVVLYECYVKCCVKCLNMFLHHFVLYKADIPVTRENLSSGFRPCKTQISLPSNRV